MALDTESHQWMDDASQPMNPIQCYPRWFSSAIRTHMSQPRLPSFNQNDLTGADATFMHPMLKFMILLRQTNLTVQ